MSYVKIRIPTEVQNALKGQKTNVPVEVLFHCIAPEYLAGLKVEEK
jgi:hypothetical protein